MIGLKLSFDTSVLDIELDGLSESERADIDRRIESGEPLQEIFDTFSACQIGDVYVMSLRLRKEPPVSD